MAPLSGLACTVWERASSCGMRSSHPHLRSPPRSLPFPPTLVQSSLLKDLAVGGRDEDPLDADAGVTLAPPEDDDAPAPLAGVEEDGVAEATEEGVEVYEMRVLGVP